MLTSIALIALLNAAPDYRLVLLYAENVRHMTVERRTTPRAMKAIRALDAETGEPIANARVYGVHNFDWKDDWIDAATTGADGVARLPLATRYAHLFRLGVEASGYLSRNPLYPGEVAHSPGVGRLADDVVDVRLYRDPAPRMGIRAPAAFVGTIVYRLGPTIYDVPFPPDFPRGQRVWWADLNPAGETIVAQPPPLGLGGWDGTPVSTVERGGEAVPHRLPGEDAADVAAWPIGVRTPDGAWSREDIVLFVGDRAGAIAAARREWMSHGNGKRGYVYDGWLAVLDPQTKRPERGPMAVTRSAPIP